MAWDWKWRKPSILVEYAERLERIELPVYKSSGGPIFKTLLSSACRMDCLYCPFSMLCNGVRRDFWGKSKLIRVFLEAYRRHVVRGLFLSSGMYADPDRVVEDLLEVVEKLRGYGYKGYIHVRLMPGVSPRLIREAARLADRIGLNLEAPGPSHFSAIAPSKGSWSFDLLSKLLYAARLKPRRGVDTQLVVGASGETDREILRLVESLAWSGVKIVHFSPYTPYPGTPLAERVRRSTPRWRIRELYEARVLISYYGFRLKDFEPLLDENGFLPPLRSTVKEELARLHPEWFPVDPASARLHELLRVPGIGLKRARRIIEIRSQGLLRLDALRSIVGGSWRKAQGYLDLSAIRR